MSENPGGVEPTSRWPNHEWKTIAPIDKKGHEERLRMVEREIERAALDVFSFLVIRQGVIVFERYFQGFSAASPMEIRSITKSFLSTLIGIALRKKCSLAWISLCYPSSLISFSISFPVHPDALAQHVWIGIV